MNPLKAKENAIWYQERAARAYADASAEGISNYARESYMIEAAWNAANARHYLIELIDSKAFA